MPILLYSENNANPNLPNKYLALVFSSLLVVNLIIEYYTGEIFIRTGKAINKKENPTSYWIELILHLIFTILMVAGSIYLFLL